jgi:hypothetical protein
MQLRVDEISSLFNTLVLYMLDGRRFSIFTDQKHLTFAFAQLSDFWTTHKSWQLSYVMEYTLDICHIAWPANVVADTPGHWCHLWTELPFSMPLTAWPTWHMCNHMHGDCTFCVERGGQGRGRHVTRLPTVPAGEGLQAVCSSSPRHPCTSKQVFPRARGPGSPSTSLL